MASPFKVFRKHQKVMLAVVGLMAMISFVVLPVLLKMLSTASVRDSLVVSTSEYGDLRESGVRQLVANRQIVLGFLQRVASTIPKPQNRRPALQWSSLIGIATEEDVVDTWLMAQRGQDLGMVVSNESINQLLASLTTAQGISGSQVKGILKDLRITDGQLFELLRKELLAIRLKEMFNLSLIGSTPGQRWDYYKRLNLKAELELVPIEVSKFVNEVKKLPDEDQLKEFFEQHKTKFENPTSPEPGFRTPEKIALEYIKGNYDKLVDPESIPDKDVIAYYEQNKDQFYRREELPEVEEEEELAEDDTASQKEDQTKDASTLQPVQPDTGTESPSETESATDPTKAPAPTETPALTKEESSETDVGEGPVPSEDSGPGPASEPAEMEPDETKPPATEGPLAEPAEADEPAAAPVDPPTTGPPTKGDETATDAAGERESQEEDQPEPDPSSVDGASATRGSSLFRLTAFQQENSEQDLPEGKNGQKDTSSEGPGAEEARSTEAEPAENVPATADEPAGGEESGKEQTAEQEIESIVDSAVTEPKSEYIPLEDVEAQIRGSLARERVQDLVDQLRDRMQQYYFDWVDYDLLSDGDKKDTGPPRRPDLAALAKTHGMTAYRTTSKPPYTELLSSSGSTSKAELISAVQFGLLDIGQSKVNRNVSFVEYAFSSLQLNKPDTSQDLEGDYYLFWKLDEAEERIPKFDEVRRRVLARWKEIQARKLALDEATKLASQARDAKKPLKEVFPEMPLIETEPFAWNRRDLSYIFNPQPRPAEISEIKLKIQSDTITEGGLPNAVDMPGKDFMQAVFHPKNEDGTVTGIDVGNVGVAMNQPKTVAYVYRVKDLSNVPEDLFFKESYDLYRYVGVGESVEANWAWLDQLRASVDFKWERDPIRGRRG